MAQLKSFLPKCDERKKTYCVLLVLIFCFSSTVVNAHQQQLLFTSILFNLRSKNVEIAHRIYIHDAEHVAKRLDKNDYDLLTSANARATFSRYVDSRFSLALAQQTSTKLKVIGEEVEGKFLWVYQEAPLPQGFSSKSQLNMALQHEVLLEFFPKQKNRVNIEVGGRTRSWVFERGRSTQSLQIGIATESD